MLNKEMLDLLVQRKRLHLRSDGTPYCVVTNAIGDTKSQVDQVTRQVIVPASSNTVDRMGDIIDPKGWVYKKGAPILIDHRYEVDKVVGHLMRAWREGDVWWNQMQFDSADLNDTARMTFNKIVAGSLRTVSVGFIPVYVEKVLDDQGHWTGGFHFKEQEHIETSWVAVPANPDASLAAESAAKTASLETQSAPDTDTEGDDLLLMATAWKWYVNHNRR